MQVKVSAARDARLVHLAGDHCRVARSAPGLGGIPTAAFMPLYPPGFVSCVTKMQGSSRSIPSCDENTGLPVTTPGHAGKAKRSARP